MSPDSSPLPPRILCGRLHCADCHAALPFLVTTQDYHTALRLRPASDAANPDPHHRQRLTHDLRQILAQSANRHVGCPRRRLKPGSAIPGFLFVSCPN